MYANDPEMAKKWEKEETLREKLRGIIKRELEATTTSAVSPYDTPQAFSKSTQKAIDVDDEDDEKHESVNEVRLVGYDKSYLDNAKKRLKVPHEITNIEYNQTRYRGPHDKFVKIFYKLKWKPGTRLDTEEKYVSVFYDSPERLKMIGKTLKLKLKESVKEATSSKDFFSGSKVTNSLPRATLSLLNSKLNKASDVIIKITDKYKKQGDIDELVKIWMRGLHLRLKKSGIKMESVNEAEKKWTDYGNHFKQLSLGFKQVPFWKKLNKNQKEAISIALIMGGDMTGAIAEIEKIKAGLSKDKKVKNALRVANESINESDLGLTYKKGKTVKVTHKKSGKELVIIDKPNVKKEYEKIGYFAEGQVNELSMPPFSSQEAKLHINADIRDMSKLLGKTSQQVIKIMMGGVKSGKYTAMDISRGIKEGPANRTHFGEMTFIQSLWNKMREKFRRYSKDRKLS